MGSVKGFTWYSLKISFWIMIFFWIFTYVIPANEGRGLFFGLLFIASVIFTFIVSIIHLTKHKEKVFAIISLVISVIVFFSLLGFLRTLIVNLN